MSDVRCQDCGGRKRFAAEPCYSCSPHGWMADYKRRRGGRTQNEGLERAAANMIMSGERRQVNRGTYRRILAGAGDEKAAARWRADRPGQLAVIARARGLSGGLSPGEISRSAAMAAASSPGADRCSGPGCTICGYARSKGWVF